MCAPACSLISADYCSAAWAVACLHFRAAGTISTSRPSQTALVGNDARNLGPNEVKVIDLIGTMELQLIISACLLFGTIEMTHLTHMNPVSRLLYSPQGPQMFPCLTYLERNVRVDCEFPETYQVPGPYCEYRQDSRLVGSTYPNMVTYVSTEDRRRSNVSLVNSNLCRLTWAPLADERPFTYTCRVYQGNDWKENSMAIHHRHLPICSAISVMFESAPFLLSLVMSLPVAVGLLSP